MEALYKKLYEKYNKLKASKVHEMDELNKDQEVKYVNCVTAAEELIQHLKSENEQLRAQVKDLLSEMASIRSTADERCIDYQKQLMEENRKNNLLSGEVEKLQQLQLAGNFGSSYIGKNDSIKMNLEAKNLSEKSSTSLRSTRKHSRDAPPAIDQVLLLSGNTQDDAMQEHSSNMMPKKSLFNETVYEPQQPACCKRLKDQSGGIVNSEGNFSCSYQSLVECLVDMELSAACRTEGICISALHKTSGYSFSLTWISKDLGGETEILYRTLSLGTFERVAPEWMKEVIVFSARMCPVFFEREIPKRRRLSHGNTSRWKGKSFWHNVRKILDLRSAEKERLVEFSFSAIISFLFFRSASRVRS